jgi:hypothetical protein
VKPPRKEETPGANLGAPVCSRSLAVIHNAAAAPLRRSPRCR